MKGYKIAVGLDRKSGPFLTMVELQTYPQATIINPNQRIAIFGDDSIQKYRTDMAAVESVTPLKGTHKNWNGKAYSLWELSEAYLFRRHVIYEKGGTITSILNMDVSESCGFGIHFFKTKADTLLYLEQDIGHYVINAFGHVRIVWNSKGSLYESRRKLLKECAK